MRSPVERERSRGLAVLPLLKFEGRGVPKVLWIHSLLVSLKCKNGNWGAGRGRQGDPRSQLFK